MGPDEEKDYNSAMLMHYNHDTEKWEEVGKLKDIKEIKIDDKMADEGDISNILKELEWEKEFSMSFDTATQLYVVYELKLIWDAKMNQMVYDISKEYPSGIGSFLRRKDAIDCIASTYGSVVSLCEGGLSSKLRARFRGIMANRSGDVIMLIKNLWDSNTKNGICCMPKIVDAFDVLDKDNTVVILIRVR